MRYGIFVNKRIVSEVDFVSDNKLYIILRGSRFLIVILSVPTLTEDKIEDLRHTL